MTSYVCISIIYFDNFLFLCQNFKKMKKIIALSIVSVLATACFKKKAVVAESKKYSNTCEPNQFWLNDNLIKEIGNQAHTGSYACVMSTKNEFGLGLKQPLIEATNNSTLQKVTVSFWVKATKMPLKASFVYSIDADKNLFWEGQPLKEIVKEENKWIFVQLEKTLPAIDNKDANIGAYIYNLEKDSFLVDDLNITFSTK